MKKSFGVKNYLFPMPTYMIGTYNDDGSVDEMMMAWGGICSEDMVALNLSADHKTVANLQKRKAFTLAVPGVDTLAESDYLGTVSGNTDIDKFSKTGLHAVKSENVDAPVVEEYPVTLECVLEKMEQEPYGLRVLGRIVNVLVDEKVIGVDGKIDASKIHAFAFDQENFGYYEMGKLVGKAWESGNKFIK